MSVINLAKIQMPMLVNIVMSRYTCTHVRVRYTLAEGVVDGSLAIQRMCVIILAKIYCHG